MSSFPVSRGYPILYDIGGRILQGTGQAMLEFLVGSTLAEIYYLHERGVPVAYVRVARDHFGASQNISSLWNLALLNGINITRECALDLAAS
jgi:hypothetical protein